MFYPVYPSVRSSVFRVLLGGMPFVSSVDSLGDNDRGYKVL